MSNAVIGMCPKCNDLERSCFLQSIYTNALFNAIDDKCQFNRNSLFCSGCIESGKKKLWPLEEKPKEISSNSAYSVQGIADEHCLETPMQSPEQFGPIQQTQIGEDMPNFLQENMQSAQYKPWKHIDVVWNPTQQANNRINEWSYPMEENWDQD